MLNHLKKYQDLVEELEELDDQTFFNWYQDNFDELEGNEDMQTYLRYRIEKYFNSNLFDKRNN